ncbi:hypothetical protein OY671_006718 [Metschnikowia pulcherrima]|nr:hypothetical protein OY671_006718 [Metschnikowia pulcherrima]
MIKIRSHQNTPVPPKPDSHMANVLVALYYFPRPKISSNHRMSRLRRLDRAILSEGADTPLDSEDQELLIAQLVEQNHASLRLFTKTLVGSILVEIPISVLALRFSSESARPVVLLLVSHVLTLVNCLYDFKPPRSTQNDVNSEADSFQNSPSIRDKAVFVAKKLMSFHGVLTLNIIVFLQLTYKLYTSQGLKLIDLLLLLPLINMVAVTLIRHWYSSVAYEISGLHDLKYKFKTA